MTMANLVDVGEQDRRTSGRLRLTIKVKLTWGRNSGVGYSLDISEKGMFIETKAMLALETRVRLEFTMIGDNKPCPVVVNGRVARTMNAAANSGEGEFNGLGIALDRFECGEQPFKEAALGQRAQKTTHRAKKVAEGSQANGIDRRQAARIPVGIPILWDVKNPPKKGGQIGNLSESGAFVIGADETAPVGAKLFVEFELPISGRMMTVRGVAQVVREVPLEIGKPSGMGIEFSASTMDVDVLRKFIERRRRVARSPIGRRPQQPKSDSKGRRTDIDLQLEWGQVRPGFLVKAGAAFVSGLVVLQVILAVMGVSA